MSVDQETQGFLKDAKQGKSRKFCMVCKGTKILCLYVFKKGKPAKYQNKAKKDGHTGQGYYGVIAGKGENLNFQLARSDGFDSDPVKTKTLRDQQFPADEKCG